MQQETDRGRRMGPRRAGAFEHPPFDVSCRENVTKVKSKLNEAFEELRADLIEPADLPGPDDLSEEAKMIPLGSGHPNDDASIERLDVKEADPATRNIFPRAEVRLVVLGDLDRSMKRMAIFLAKLMAKRRKSI